MLFYFQHDLRVFVADSGYVASCGVRAVHSDFMPSTTWQPPEMITDNNDFSGEIK